MAKDFAKNNSAKKKSGATSIPVESERKKPSVLLVLLAIAALSGLAYGLYTLNQVPKNTTVTPAPKAQEKKETKEQKPAPEESTKRHEFDFYKILPNSEVTTSPVDAYKPDPSKPKVKYDYMLQTGSFKNLQDAERQKASIAFQGLRASVSQVKSSSGTIWHRVEVGPYQSRSKMNSAIDKLVAINIQPLVKKTARE